MAEIAHVYAEELTGQTHTGDLTYTTKLTVDGSNFAANSKYLLVLTAQIGGDNSNGRFKFRTQLDAVTPTGSEHIMEPVSSGATFRHSYAFMTVWSPGETPGDVTFQIAPHQNTDDTVRADTIQLLAIRIDDDLTENTDWFFDEDVTNTDHATSGWDDRASITFTPGTADDDWLIIAAGQWIVDNIGKNVQYRINQDSDTAVAPLLSQEGEDTAEQLVWMLTRVYTLSDESHTLTVQSQDDAASGAENNHNRSAIFAINLEKFRQHNKVWNEAEFTPADADTWEEIHALSVTPEVVGNWVVLGTATIDSPAFIRANIRSQLAGVTIPTSKDSMWDTGASDETNEDFIPLLSYLPSLAASLQDIDIDYRAVLTSCLIEDRSFVAFSLELAEIPPPAIQGDVTLTQIPGATLDYILHGGVVGDVTNTQVPGATMAFTNFPFTITGDVTLTQLPGATMDWTFKPSIVGGVTNTQTPGATMLKLDHEAITGGVTLIQTPGATMQRNIHPGLVGGVTSTQVPGATMEFTDFEEEEEDDFFLQAAQHALQE